MSESPQTELYKSILKDCMLIKVIVQVVQNGGNTDGLPAEAKSLYVYTFGESPLEKLNMAWEGLQTNVNNIIDKNQGAKLTRSQGLKQVNMLAFFLYHLILTFRNSDYRKEEWYNSQAHDGKTCKLCSSFSYYARSKFECRGDWCSRSVC